jgi:uncharacterized protein (UPF0332 family)
MQNLENLVKAGQLKKELPLQSEVDGLIRAARQLLKDSQISSLSKQGKFELSYSAAHSLSLAALRWHGYRSENRFIVFQCLVHTIGLENSKVRILSDAHNKRNKSAYEGEADVVESQIQSIISVSKNVLALLEKLGPV